MVSRPAVLLLVAAAAYVDAGSTQSLFGTGRTQIKSFWSGYRGIGFSVNGGQIGPSHFWNSMPRIVDGLNKLMANGYNIFRFWGTYYWQDQVCQYITNNNIPLKIQGGIWIDARHNNGEWVNQIEKAMAIILKYPKLFLGVSIGNEQEYGVGPALLVQQANYMIDNYPNVDITYNFLQQTLWNPSYKPFLQALTYVNVNAYTGYFQHLYDHAWTPHKQLQELKNYNPHQLPLGKVLILGEAGWQSWSGDGGRVIPSVNRLIEWYRICTAYIYSGNSKFASMFFFNLVDENWKGADDGWGLYYQGDWNAIGAIKGNFPTVPQILGETTPPPVPGPRGSGPNPTPSPPPPSPSPPSPTKYPTSTNNPTNYPTLSPIATPSPATGTPTQYPTNNPTKYPTGSPIATPSPATGTPTQYPTNNPTKYPTGNPIATPSPATGTPTQYPTNNPTMYPTQNPVTLSPLKGPETGSPTQYPTLNPTLNPTPQTTSPTQTPTTYPTRNPLTGHPLTVQPLTGPETANPTSTPLTGSPVTSSPVTGIPVTGSPVTDPPTESAQSSPVPSPSESPTNSVCPAGGPSASSNSTGDGSFCDYFESLADYSTASQCCRERGGNLLIISNAEENSLANSLQQGSVVTQSWIGLKYDSGGFKWTDGSPLSYSPWASRQPKFSKNGHAVVIRRPTGKWATIPAKHKRAFLCSRPSSSSAASTTPPDPSPAPPAPAPPAPSPPAPTPPDSNVCPASGPKATSVITGDGGSNVRKVEYFDGVLKFADASQCCNDRGGNLLTLSNSNENAAANALQKSSSRKNTWIGLRYDQGNFGWVDGTEVSYTYWGHSQPKKSQGGYAAVMRKNTGKWQTSAANLKRSFFCSIPV